MKPEATGSGHLCLFLLASLLVHLGIVCVVTGGRDGAGGRKQLPAALTVEYLDLSSLRLPPPASGGEVAGSAAERVVTAGTSTVPVGGVQHREPSPLTPSQPLQAPHANPGIPAAGVETVKRPGPDAAVSSGAAQGQGRESQASTFSSGAAFPVGGNSARAYSGSSPVTGSKEVPAVSASKQAHVEGAGKKGASAPLRGTYQLQLKSLIESHKKYPMAARRSRQEGSCVRRFSLGRDGTLRSVENVTSCGHPFLEEAATSAVTSVGTFPPLPDEFGADESFSVTIIFTLAGK